MTDTSAPTRLRMDPRIRERRVAVQRDLGRRRLRLLLAGGGVVLAVAIAYGLTRSPVFDVDEVRVLGAAKTTPEQIAEAGGLERSPQLADVKPAIVARRLERLPWVQEARVVRHWPGTVEVTLLERTPLAAVPGPEDRWTLLDPTGRVLAEQQGQPPEMTRVELPAAPGPPGSTVASPVRTALGIVEALPEPLVGRVPVVRVAEDATIELVLDGKVPVRFGPASDVRAKVVALTTLVQKADLARVTSIDVRAPTAPVLTRR